MLGIPLNLGPDIGYKRGKFPKTLSEKSLEFIPSKGGGTVTFGVSLVLLSTEIDPIPKKRGCKGDELESHGTSCVKMIIVLLTEVVALHVRATIVQVGVPGLE